MRSAKFRELIKFPICSCTQAKRWPVLSRRGWFWIEIMAGFESDQF
jgi:hypothetical protein